MQKYYIYFMELVWYETIFRFENFNLLEKTLGSLRFLKILADRRFSFLTHDENLLWLIWYFDEKECDQKYFDEKVADLDRTPENTFFCNGLEARPFYKNNSDQTSGNYLIIHIIIKCVYVYVSSLEMATLVFCFFFVIITSELCRNSKTYKVVSMYFV